MSPETSALIGRAFPLPLRRVALRIARWRALGRERRALARLDPRLLRDIGVEPAAAQAEAARPAWDPPGHWTR